MHCISYLPNNIPQCSVVAGKHVGSHTCTTNCHLMSSSANLWLGGVLLLLLMLVTLTEGVLLTGSEKIQEMDCNGSYTEQTEETKKAQN